MSLCYDRCRTAQGRFAIINVWRSIRDDPVERFPLAVSVCSVCSVCSVSEMQCSASVLWAELCSVCSACVYITSLHSNVYSVSLCDSMHMNCSGVLGRVVFGSGFNNL